MIAINYGYELIVVLIDGDVRAEMIHITFVY